MKPLKYYFAKAKKEKFAIGQFNFSDWSQVKGILAAAQEAKAPIILGTSEGESKFVGLQEAVAMRDILRKKTKLPIFLNLDHGKSFDYIKQAILAGYDMVHFDGSKLPLEENIKISKKVVTLAKKYGVVVEGEVGRIGTDASRIYTEKFEIKEEELTKPEDASLYVKKTGVDVLAISIGSFHGLDVSGVSPSLKLDRLAHIANITDIPFVLHGGSGIPKEDILGAISGGIAKINVNTETRLAFAGALKNALTQTPEITPYKFLQEPISAVQKVITEKLNEFGLAGKA